MSELVAQGYTVGELELAEQYVQPGNNAELRVFYDRELSPDEVEMIESELFYQGIELTGPVTFASGMLIIPFKKSSPEGIGFAFVPIATVASIIGGGSIFGWQLFSDGVDDTMDKIFKITIVGGAVIIGLIAIKVIM